MKRLLIMLFLEEGIASTHAQSKSALQCSRNFKEASMAVVAGGRGRTVDNVRIRWVGEHRSCRSFQTM